MEQHFYEITRYVIVLLVGVIGKLFWDKIARLTEDVSRLDAAQEEIKSNYISRFEDVKGAVGTSSDRVLTEMNNLKVMIAEHYVRRNDCYRLHEIGKTPEA